MKQVKVLITPDGKFKHIYNDNLLRMDKALGNVEVTRASHVEFDNQEQCWRVRINTCLLPGKFAEREAALNYEVQYLEANCLRE